MEAAALAALPDEQMLEIVQRQTFNFFSGMEPIPSAALPPTGARPAPM